MGKNFMETIKPNWIEIKFKNLITLLEIKCQMLNRIKIIKWRFYKNEKEQNMDWFRYTTQFIQWNTMIV